MTSLASRRSRRAALSDILDRLCVVLIRLHLCLQSSPWPDRVRRVFVGFCVWPLAAWWIWRDTAWPRPVKWLAWGAAAVWLFFLFTGRRATF
jgi:hypothetical protein